MIRQLRAGWRAGDVLLCGDWTLLRLFPPLRAAWALQGTQATVPVTGANAMGVLFGLIYLGTAHRFVLIRRRGGGVGCRAGLEDETSGGPDEGGAGRERGMMHGVFAAGP